MNRQAEMQDKIIAALTSQHVHRIVNTVRRLQQTDRLNLARRLDMSNSRLCDLVQGLIDAGYLLEDHPGGDRRGRRPIPMRVNPEIGIALGCDMEARHLRLVALDFAGNPLWHTAEDMDGDAGADKVRSSLTAFLLSGRQQVERLFPGVPILALGMAGPGRLDIDKGVISFYSLIPGMEDFPLAEIGSQALGLAPVLQTTIRSITVAEWGLGAAQGLQNFLCVAVTSGIDAGMVIDGAYYAGHHGRAGLLNIVRGFEDHNTPLVDIIGEKALLAPGQALDEIDPEAARRASTILARLLADLALLMDPQAIVLAGRLVLPGGPLWEMTNSKFQELLPGRMRERVALRPCLLGEEAAAVGAAERALAKVRIYEEKARAMFQ